MSLRATSAALSAWTRLSRGSMPRSTSGRMISGLGLALLIGAGPRPVGGLGLGDAALDLADPRRAGADDAGEVGEARGVQRLLDPELVGDRRVVARRIDGLAVLDLGLEPGHLDLQRGDRRLAAAELGAARGRVEADQHVAGVRPAGRHGPRSPGRRRLRGWRRSGDARSGSPAPGRAPSGRAW